MGERRHNWVNVRAVRTRRDDETSNCRAELQPKIDWIQVPIGRVGEKVELFQLLPTGQETFAGIMTTVAEILNRNLLGRSVIGGSSVILPSPTIASRSRAAQACVDETNPFARQWTCRQQKVFQLHPRSDPKVEGLIVSWRRLSEVGRGRRVSPRSYVGRL